MHRESAVCGTITCLVKTTSANRRFPSAEKFNVTLPFLLQHVAWLYDRRLSQVRAQFRRVGHQNPISGQATSAGGGTPGGSVPMNRSGSDGMAHQRTSIADAGFDLKKLTLGQDLAYNLGCSHFSEIYQQQKQTTAASRLQIYVRVGSTLTSYKYIG